MKSLPIVILLALSCHFVPALGQRYCTTLKLAVEVDSPVHLNLPPQSLSEFPDSFFLIKDLEVLYLGNQDIFTLPENLGDLKTLKNLAIKDLPLSYLPESICELENLKYFSLAGTSITALPDCLGK